MANMIDILAENEKLRAQVATLLPFALAQASSLVSGVTPYEGHSEKTRAAAMLLDRISTGEFGEPS